MIISGLVSTEKSNRYSAIRGKGLAEVMHNQDFEQLVESEKEEIIKQPHVRWIYPDSEVRNRINRSPNIL